MRASLSIIMPLERQMSIGSMQTLDEFFSAVLERGLAPHQLTSLAESRLGEGINKESLISLANDKLKLNLNSSKLRSAFDNLDMDGSGYLDTSELHMAMREHSKRALDKVSASFKLSHTESIKEKNSLLVALVAHNEMKRPLLHFVSQNMAFFSTVNIVTTGSTGGVLEKSLGLQVKVKVSSGPLGGDQEIGAMVARNECGAAFFFIDPLSAHPHESDIQALTRICNVHNVPCATNPMTAKALVYAFANEIIMRETLYPKTQRENSHAVEAYKKKQQSVINDVSST